MGPQGEIDQNELDVQARRKKPLNFNLSSIWLKSLMMPGLQREGGGKMMKIRVKNVICPSFFSSHLEILRKSLRH